MLVNISEITESITSKKVEYEIVGDELGEPSALKAQDLTLSYYRAGETICFRFTGTVTVDSVCDRCLDELELELDIDEDYYIFPENTPDVDYFYSGEFIDVDEYVREIVVMNMPGKVLCDEECKGLCSKCGANLNYGDCGCDAGDKF